jgi:hypothetical protein
MKNLLNLFLVVVLLTGINSCENNSPSPETINPETIDHTKDFLNGFKVDRSDRDSEYSIHAEFDGKLIYFTAFWNGDDNGWNTLFVDQSIGLDQINLIRQDQTHSVQIAFYFQQTNIFNRQLPHIIPPGGYEFAEIELMNRKRSGSVVPGSPQDDFIFTGHTFDMLQIVVTGFKDHIMEGTFDGYLKSKSGSSIEVKNGHFRIKIKVTDMYNQVIK